MATVNANVKWATNTEELKASILSGIGVISAMKQSVDRTAESLGGAGLFTAANRATAAIEQLGGITKLTAGEQERYTALLDKAIEKYDVMGMKAPAAMVALRDSMKDTTTAWEGFVGEFNVKEAIENPMGAAKGAVSALAETMGGAAVAALGAVTALVAVGVAVFELAERAAAAGGHIQDMSEKTGMTVPAVSKLSLASKVAGSDIDAMAAALFKFEQNLGNGSDKFQAALGKIGLTMDEVKAAGPDQWLMLLAEHLKALDDPSERAAAGAELFGRQYREIVPTLNKLNEGLALTADIMPWTPEQAAAAEQFDMQITAMKVHTEAFGIEVGRSLIAPVSATIPVVVDAGRTLATTMGIYSGILPGMILAKGAWDYLSAGIDVVRGTLGQLPGSVESGKKSLQELRDAAFDAARGPDQLVKSWKAAVADQGAHALAMADYELKDAEKSLTEEVTKRVAEAKKAAEAQQAWLTNTLEVTSASGSLADRLAELDGRIVEGIRYYLDHGVALDKIAKMYGVTKEQAEAVATEIKFLGSVTDATSKSFGTHLGIVSLIAPRYGDAHAALTGLNADGETLSATMIGNDAAIFGFANQEKYAEQQSAGLRAALAGLNTEGTSLKDALSELSNAFQAMAQIGGSSFQGLAKDIGRVVAALNLATKSGDQFKAAVQSGDKTGTVVGAVGMVGAVASATEGGGASGIAGGALSGMEMGAAIGSVVPVIGTVIGGAIGAIGGAIVGIARSFGASQAELAGRDVEATFEKQFGGFQGMMDQVGAAYAATGRSAQQAQDDVKRLMDAEKQGGPAVQAVIDQINQAFTDQKTQVANVATAVASLQSAVQTAGGVMPAALQPMIAQLMAMPGLTDAEKAALQGLTAAVEPDFQKLTQTATTYGISLAALGPKFQQANLDSASAVIFKDFTDLTGAGANVGGVLLGMSGKIGQLVIDSKNFGVAIPENMQPLIQNLIETGHLTDQNGQLLTDMTGIKFEDTPLDKGTNAIVQAINHLGDLLSNLPGIAKTAADGIGANLSSVQAPTLDFHYRFVQDGASPDTSFAATGGLVTGHGVQYLAGGGSVLPFMPRGTDTVPAMLTPGEGVVSRRGMSMLGRGGLSALNAGQGGQVIDLSAVREELSALRASQQRLTTYFTTQAAADQARAMRDELQKVVRR